MKLFCTASKDTYITNKIINNRLVADDANVGRAGTLDLFRLYNETTLRGSGSQDEVSRLLIKFDYSNIKELTGSKVNLNSSKFTAKLKLFDIVSGHAVPSNFNVVVFPLSQSFDEGVGRDIGSFGDLDIANFLTASYKNGSAVLWNLSGANKTGLLGSDDIDIIESGNLSDGNGLVALYKSKLFEIGTEDLEVDVTSIVSATLAGLIPDHGLRISFSGTEETDRKSRFVKRFASRHVSNPFIRPRIEVSFDDSIADNHGDFLFDASGSLFLQNYERSSRANIVSGSALTPVTGDDCMKLKLKKDSYEFTIDVSQHTEGTGNNQVLGLYSASFAIPSNVTTKYDGVNSLAKLIAKEKEVTFEEFWQSADTSVGYHTGSITLKIPTRSANNLSLTDPEIYAINLLQEYDKSDKETIRLFGLSHINVDNKPRKKPVSKKSEIFSKVFYRIKDYDNGKIIIDFGESDNSTRVSSDRDGMFFDFHFDILPIGRTYTFEYLIIDRGTRLISRDERSHFRVK
jgi:hypothetical protein